MSRKRLGLWGAAGAVFLAASGVYLWKERGKAGDVREPAFVGSASCKKCHAKFYELWEPSHHGKAMQPFTPALAARELGPQKEPIEVAGASYWVRFDRTGGWVIERKGQEERAYPILHVLGGKNVYYFLTQLDRGRLQVLPLAYDVRAREWYDTAASAVRHFPDLADAPLHWTERPYTFNTSCYSCHVSQLTTHYDPASGTYRTSWLEPGINCETCHGPAGEHVRVCGSSSQACQSDPRITRTLRFSADQMNSLCAPCHAKMIPITNTFRPGERYFDHFDLVSLEDRDFYPDGRDLGENYTFTLWRLNPCQKAGRLDCNHCHTPSGRNRFSREQPNEACLPCHQDKVRAPEVHTHHRPDSPGSQCIACHMPVTTFARMRRSDHSMLPPAPAATLEFGSPNACNLCHTDRDARWADQWVRRWHKRDYQAPVLERARLVQAARRGDWSWLPKILDYLARPDREEVYATALIRLLRGCEDERKWPVFRRLLEDPSPWVRAAAAEAFSTYDRLDMVGPLLQAVRDEYRLVRIRAAASLAAVPREMLAEEDRAALDRATEELLAAYRTRPDDPAGYTNLGNFYLSRRNLAEAIRAFEMALQLEPNSVPALVNAALAYNMAGRNEKAEQCLRRAVKLEPKNAAAQFNLGLLLGELGRVEEARQALLRAWEAEPGMGAAAYNLCVLEAQKDPRAALRWCEQAVRARPAEPKYRYTLAFYQVQIGATAAAIRTLEALAREYPGYADAYLLLGQLYAGQGRRSRALELLRGALQKEQVSPQDRYRILAQLRALEAQGAGQARR